MTPIRWLDSLSLDVPAIDADHKHLLDLLNRLHYMALAGDDREAVGAVLAELVAYTFAHFAREEALMQACGYPGLAQHARLHEVLRAQVAHQRARFRADPRSFDVQGFYAFLSDWLTMHILGEDMKLKPWVAAAETAAA
jgi:hemerythrin